jgi:hypothetical protein
VEQSNKLYETGSSPYNINTDVTVKNFSNQQNTNTNDSFHTTLANFIIIQDDYKLESPVVVNDFIEVKNT